MQINKNNRVFIIVTTNNFYLNLELSDKKFEI